MKQITDNVYLLDGLPPYAINVYVIGDVLVDAATRRAGSRILRQLRGRDIRTHVITHAHPDHQGASHEVCEALKIPLWCGEHDADAMEDGRIAARQPRHPLNTVIDRFWTGPPHPVARRLREGDVVAGFEVLDVPGHSSGHVAFWRSADRTLICGDVFTNIDTVTGIPGLHEPKPFFTPDPSRNRESMRRLAALDPELVLFGHGRPLRNPAKLRAFTAKLPQS